MRTRALSLWNLSLVAALLVAIGLPCGCKEKHQDRSGPSATVSALPSASATPSLQVSPAPPPLAVDTVKGVVPAVNALGVRLYAQLTRGVSNLAFSPASIAVAFAMLRNGAAGKTERELGQVLFSGLPAEVVNWALSAQLREWNGSHQQYELAAANRIFIADELPIGDGFERDAQRWFDAPFERLDFKRAPEAARLHINAWVAGRTRDRVPNLLPGTSLDRSTKAVLVNALYFKSVWAEAFKPSDTKPSAFFVNGKVNQPSTVPSMHSLREALFAQVRDDAVSLLELAYASNDLAMLFVLPRAVDGLPQLERALSSRKLAKWVKSLQPQVVDISVPKFRIAAVESMDLVTPLIRLGLKRTFALPCPEREPCSEFARLNKDVMVTGVYHGAFLELDEQGSEAAAATAIVAATPSASEPRRLPSFRADHPFLFFLRDRRTGMVLFMGRVVAPNERQ